nr:hypothetical protein [Candidatus Microthrix sp.]
MAVAGGHRALLDQVVDARHHAVGGHLALPQADQRLHLAGKAVAGGQNGPLPAQVGHLPAQHVAEQHRSFVIEVVAGHQSVVAAVAGGFVEDVALRHATGRARRALGGPRSGGDVVAVGLDQVDLDQRQPALLGEGPRCVGRRVGVLPDAQSDVEPIGAVAERDEDVPHRQRVLAARHGDQQAVVGLHHVVIGNRLGRLVATELHEVLGAEVGIVTP